MATLLRQHAPQAARANGGVCADLYAERVVLPRVALLLALAGLAIFSALATRRLRFRRRARTRPFSQVVFVQKEDPAASAYVQKETEINSGGSSTGTKQRQQQQKHTQDMQLRKWFAALLTVGVVSTTVFLLSFQSYEFGASSGAGGGTSLSRPRVVFSFTTISDRINNLQPVMDALVAQDGEGFDAIYVVVPRVYRKKPVEIPSWLTADIRKLNKSDFHGMTFATGVSAFHEKVRIILLDTDFGPASKVLGALLVEHAPDTVIVYGDDDRIYPSQLCERALHHSAKFPNDVIAVLGGWISAEDSFYCGRSLEVGVNRVSFVGGAGGVAVKRKFFGLGKATLPAFEVANMSKSCFLGDDYYLSHLMSARGVPRRLVYDSCWNIATVLPLYKNGGLSFADSTHLGGANVEHYQQCIRELGRDQDLSGDGEFGWLFMAAFSRTWGTIRGLGSWIQGKGFRTC